MTNTYPLARSNHRHTMTAYYRIHSHFYDATRWAFLYGRRRLVEKLEIVPGERVIEIGCGTGANFAAIQSKLGNTGELIGIDCSAPMLRKAAERVRKNGWPNVRLLDLEYGKETVTRGRQAPSNRCGACSDRGHTDTTHFGESQHSGLGYGHSGRFRGYAEFRRTNRSASDDRNLSA